MIAHSWGGFVRDDDDADDDDDFVVDDAFPGGDEPTAARGFRPANDNVVAGIEAVRPEDVEAVKEGFWTKFVEVRPRLGRLGKARDLAKNTVLLFQMLVDPTVQLPWRTAAGIVFALAYFISSLDLIPDAVPVLGFFDDALVVAEVVYMFSADIKRYEQSRRARGLGGREAA